MKKGEKMTEVKSKKESPGVEKAVIKQKKEPFCIEIEGEEDLAALPAIYLAPLQRSTGT